MRMTLLEIVQNILSAMDAEEVTSITDTVESYQVAQEVKTTYYENFSNFELKSRLELLYLDDSDKELAAEFQYLYPHTLKIPDEVDNIKWFKYNTNRDVTDPVWKELEYLTPEQYLDHVTQNTNSSTTYLVRDPTNSQRYYLKSDQHPTYWTTFDNEYIVVDSFISDYVETTVGEDVTSILENGRMLGDYTMVYAEVIPPWTMSDAFTPDLDDKFFPMLLAEAKSACFINYKGVSNSKEEQRSRRQRVHHQNNRARYNEYKYTGNNYGRS